MAGNDDNNDIPPELLRWASENRHDFSKPWPKVEVETYNLTDLGNAERLIAQNRDKLRYVPGWGWVAWTGTHWDREEGESQAWECARETIRSMYRDAVNLDTEEARKLERHAQDSESAYRVKAMLEVAQKNPAMRARPEDFNTDKMLFNCPNGTVDLRSGELRPHNPEDLITQVSRVEYIQQARSEVLDGFLADITLQDADLLRYLQKSLGMSLTGRTDEDAIFLLYGPRGRNGKTSLLEAVIQAMGTYAVTTGKETVLSKSRSGGIPNDVARLNGARFVAITETDAGDRWDMARLKQMSGGDTQTARFLNHEFFDFVPQFKLWVRTNHLPNVRGDERESFWERVKVVPFLAYFGEDSGNQKKELRDQLRYDEANQQALLAWLVEGCLLWQAEGLVVPEAVKEAVAQYKASQDPLQAFLEDETTRQEGDRVVGVMEAFSRYRNWAQLANEKPLTRNQFVAAMEARGFPKGRRKDGAGGQVFTNLVWGKPL